MIFDYIIVGQGIAGSCLGFELHERNKKILIIDDKRFSACEVAAGVLNPITGKRLVKSWRSDIALPFAKEFYIGLEKKFSGKFFYDRKILQICKSEEELMLWDKRKDEAEYKDFISEKVLEDSFEGLNDKFGSFFIEHSSCVEPPTLMAFFRKFFKEKNILVNEKFDFEFLEIRDDLIKYKSLTSKRIIFCDGWRVIDNPLFNWLPYRPAKGEILTLSYEGIELPEHIIHREKWLMKIQNEKKMRLGSTWDRENFREERPSKDGGDELKRSMQTIFSKDIKTEFLGIECGVRPCTATTRPHIGSHPKFGNVFSFNGFGSKGFALSPYFSKHFYSFMEEGLELDSEANLQRHVKKFYK